MYIVFYNGGKIGKPTIAKTDTPQILKQIISKNDADKIKEKLPQLFDRIRNKDFILEQKDYNETAHIYMKEITIDEDNYLKAYFTVDKIKG